MASLLCDSAICRLCAETTINGTDLFSTEENDNNLGVLVNTYLPLKIEDDGQYPRKICPGCAIQLEATKQFFDLLIAGQNRLRELLKVQRDTLNRGEKQRKQLEEALQNVNPTSSVETYTIHSDETGEKFLIQIFSEGPLFGPEHKLSLKAEGLERPKRKRGRPPKQEKKEVGSDEQTQESSNKDESNDPSLDEPEDGGDGRRRRRRKVPSRFSEAVQGKELDKIFQEEGIAEDESNETSLENGEPDNKAVEEVIGRMETQDGQNLGDLIVFNKHRSKAKRRFQCHHCHSSFLHKTRLQSHIKTFHKKDPSDGEAEQPSEAEVPNITEDCHPDTNEDAADDGIPKDNDPLFIKSHHCKQCNRYFSCKQNYEVHYRAVHEGIKPFACRHCDRTFSYANSLRLHMLCHKREKHDSRQYQCEVCSKTFRHPSSLLYHRDAQHGDGRRYVCGKCGKEFKHRQLLQRHQLVHSDERPHRCMKCSGSFKTRANLLNHLVTHGGPGVKRYKCPHQYCDRSFAHRTSLILHERTHLGIKPYQCDLCPKSFSQKGNLREHRRIHTGEKPFQCEECGRAFTTSSQYQLHRKRHTGERPFQCEHCLKTFLNRDTWKCHVRRHMDVRPYVCTECDRAFAELSALKKHERLHTGEKPYQCEECPKAFADSSNLTKHRRIHQKGADPVKLVQQLVDGSGQPISVSTPEGQQIRVVSNGDQVYGLMPDGTLALFDLTLQEAAVEPSEQVVNPS